MQLYSGIELNSARWIDDLPSNQHTFIHQNKVHKLYQIIFNVTAVETQDQKKACTPQYTLDSMNETSGWMTTQMQWSALALGMLYLSLQYVVGKLEATFKYVPSCQEEMQQLHQLLLQWNQQQTQQASRKDSPLQAGK